MCYQILNGEVHFYQDVLILRLSYHGNYACILG
jgi:hypothetical protein